ncbi:MAG: GNAT family N-acetyltransferase [Ferruginibacter sp.]
MKINFRLLTAADIESYRQLRLACLKNYPDNFGTTYEEALLDGSSKFSKILATNNGNDFMFGAFSNDTLIGICGFIQQGRSKTNHHGEIVQMYVDPSFAGKGTGTTLLKHTIEKAFENKAIDQVLLSVVYSNEKAVATYKKIGFAEYGKLENYFKEDGRSWTQLFMVLLRECYTNATTESTGT